MQRNKPRYANKPVYPADALRSALMRMKGGAPLRKMASVMLDGKAEMDNPPATTEGNITLTVNRPKNLTE